MTANFYIWFFRPTNKRGAIRVQSAFFKCSRASKLTYPQAQQLANKKFNFKSVNSKFTYPKQSNLLIENLILKD